MKRDVYTITVTTSEGCDFDEQVFLDREEAIKEWDKSLKEQKSLRQEALANGEISTHDADSEGLEEDDNKHYEYDNGKYFVLLSFVKHEVNDKEE